MKYTPKEGGIVQKEFFKFFPYNFANSMSVP